MSTPAIGSYEFIQMRGPQVPSLAAAIEVIDRPAVDSVATRENANKAEEIQLQTIEAITSESNAKSRADDYADLLGTRVTITDGIGRSTTKVLILGVIVTKVQKINTCNMSGVDYLAYASWRVKPTQ